MKCVNCGEEIRPTNPDGDGVDPADYAWVHDNGGNPICPFTFVATPPGTVGAP